MKNSVKYLIIIVIILLFTFNYISALLNTEQRQPSYVKPSNDSSEIKTAWVEDSHHNPKTVMPFMAYRGYVYRHDDRVGELSSNLKYVGTYYGQEFFRSPNDTGTPPFHLWAKRRRYNNKSLDLFIRTEKIKSSSTQSIRAVGLHNDLELAIELPMHPYSTEVQYWAKLSLKNLSSNDIELTADKLFELQIIDSTGYKIWPERNWWGRPVPYVIESGGTYSTLHQFTISSPGKYTILCQLKYNSGKIGKINEYGLVDGVSFNPPTIKISPREITVK